MEQIIPNEKPLQLLTSINDHLAAIRQILADAHECEVVLTGKVIDDKTLDSFAEKIYPRLKKLKAWGH